MPFVHVSVLVCAEDYYRRKDFMAAMPEVAFDGGVAGIPDSPPPASKAPTRVRMEFPETWLWSDSVAGYCLA